MMENGVDAAVGAEKAEREFAGPRFGGGQVLSDDVKRHFRENFAVFLDGALSPCPISGFLLRQARQSLSRRGDEPRIMSSAALREALESVAAAPVPSTRAGLVAIAPRRARVWWDPGTIDGLDDIIAGLVNPVPVLRFFDVTGLDPAAGRWNSVFDIPVDIAEKGRTIDFWAADRSYIVELGFVHADGRFLGLARTNLATLPREGRGEAAAGAVARANLAPRSRPPRRETTPDRAAGEWAEARPDHPRRDIEAELVVHMLYRAFLESGPRALRSALRISRRDSAILRQEFVQRSRRRDRAASVSRSPDAPLMLVVSLGAAGSGRNDGICHPPALRPLRLSDLPDPSPREFVRFGQLAAFSRAGRLYLSGSPDLRRPTAVRTDLSPSCAASSVFEAAVRLRYGLSRISRVAFLPGNREKPFAAARKRNRLLEGVRP